MDTRLQERIIGFLLFVVGKENQTAYFICKKGNSLMCKSVVRSALPLFGGRGWGGGGHGIPAIVIFSPTQHNGFKREIVNNYLLLTQALVAPKVKLAQISECACVRASARRTSRFKH